MSESQESILEKPIWTVHLTENEYRLIKRVRDAAQTGQQLIIDTDSMTWRAIGKMENVRRH